MTIFMWHFVQVWVVWWSEYYLLRQPALFQLFIAVEDVGQARIVLSPPPPNKLISPTNIFSIVCQRLRRWSNFKIELGQCLVLAECSFIHKTPTQCCFDTGTASQTLDHHQTSTGWLYVLAVRLVRWIPSLAGDSGGGETSGSGGRGYAVRQSPRSPRALTHYWPMGGKPRPLFLTMTVRFHINSAVWVLRSITVPSCGIRHSVSRNK